MLEEFKALCTQAGVDPVNALAVRKTLNMSMNDMVSRLRDIVALIELEETLSSACALLDIPEEAILLLSGEARLTKAEAAVYTNAKAAEVAKAAEAKEAAKAIAAERKLYQLVEEATSKKVSESLAQVKSFAKEAKEAEEAAAKAAASTAEMLKEIDDILANL